MYKAGEYIVYSGQGVCKVLDVTMPPSKNLSDKGLFYVLAPVYGQCKIYIPVNTKIFMRQIITQKAATDLLKKLPDMQAIQCTSRVNAVLNAEYRGYLKTNDCETMLRLLKGLYLRKKQCKKMGLIDTDYQKRLETLLFGECKSCPNNHNQNNHQTNCGSE